MAFWKPVQDSDPYFPEPPYSASWLTSKISAKSGVRMLTFLYYIYQDAFPFNVWHRNSIRFSLNYCMYFAFIPGPFTFDNSILVLTRLPWLNNIIIIIIIMSDWSKQAKSAFNFSRAQNADSSRTFAEWTFYDFIVLIDSWSKFSCVERSHSNTFTRIKSSRDCQTII